MTTKVSFPILFCIAALTAVGIAADRPSKPNVVLILTDDLGWQDVGCYDIDEPLPMKTPHIDGLAERGVMFWQGYSPAPTCAPSRCATMSGVHPARAQKTHVVGGAPPVPRSQRTRMMVPWYSGRMPAGELTIARVLQQNGYVTDNSGKWHMGINHNAFPQPGDQGCDWTRSNRGSRQPMKDRLKDFATTEPDDPFRLDDKGYPFHETNVDSLTFLREHKDRPLFLYYATWLVHSPIQHSSLKALTGAEELATIYKSEPVPSVGFCMRDSEANRSLKESMLKALTRLAGTEDGAAACKTFGIAGFEAVDEKAVAELLKAYAAE